MDRIWQWAWDQHGTRYSLAMCVISICLLVPVYVVFSFFIVAFEESDRYVGAAAVTFGAVLVMVFLTVFPGLGAFRQLEQWAAGGGADRATVLNATYTFTRKVKVRAVVAHAVGAPAYLSLWALSRELPEHDWSSTRLSARLSGSRWR